VFFNYGEKVIKSNRIKTAVFWDMKTCRPMDGYQCFGGNLLVWIQGRRRPQSKVWWRQNLKA